METHLPTLVSGDWTVTALRDSLVKHVRADARGTRIEMYFYAVTETGWKAVRSAFRKWKARADNRQIVAYIGTDHALTETDALRLMIADGVAVRLMTAYYGTFHPKVVWLQSKSGNRIWIGSNNLTRDGLLNNIEFAAVLVSRVAPKSLRKWADQVHQGSVLASAELLDEYDQERARYGEQRASVGTFTWTRRERSAATQPRSRSRAGARTGLSRASAGDLVIEVMPRETGAGGKQIQLPMAAATDFFHMPSEIGATRTVHLSPSWISDPRALTMTIFANRTVRLVIKELDYRDRPCVLQFRRLGENRFVFDIVSRSTFPARYRGLLERTNAPTRVGSRRWAIIA